MTSLTTLRSLITMKLKTTHSNIILNNMDKATSQKESVVDSRSLISSHVHLGSRSESQAPLAPLQTIAVIESITDATMRRVRKDSHQSSIQ